MSDSRARQLERKWLETRSLEDETALIREQIRIGILTGDQVELAAICGHPAAQLALGNEGAADPEAWSARANTRPEPDKQRIALRLGEFLLTTIGPRLAMPELEFWADAPDIAERIIAGAFDRRNDEDQSKLSVVKSLYLRAEDLGPAEQAAHAALEECFSWLLSGAAKSVDLEAIARQVFPVLESFEADPLSEVLRFLRRDGILCGIPVVTS